MHSPFDCALHLSPCFHIYLWQCLMFLSLPHYFWLCSLFISVPPSSWPGSSISDQDLLWPCFFIFYCAYPSLTMPPFMTKLQSLSAPPIFPSRPHIFYLALWSLNQPVMVLWLCSEYSCRNQQMNNGWRTGSCNRCSEAAREHAKV